MKFRHPSITQGRIVHPVHGDFPIVDGIIDCPEALGLELKAEWIPDPPAPEPPADPGSKEPPPEATDEEPPPAVTETSPTEEPEGEPTPSEGTVRSVKKPRAQKG